MSTLESYGLVSVIYTLYMIIFYLASISVNSSW